MNRHHALLGLAVMLVGLYGCGGEAPAAVPSPVAAVAPSDPPTPEPTPEATPEPTPEVTDPPPVETPEPLPTPIARGTSVEVLDGDWTIKVGKVNFDAWKKVKAANMFNDKPPKGMVDVLIPITAVYHGDGRDNLDPAVHLLALGDATATERSMFEEPTCGVIPKDLYMDDPTVRKGGKVSGNVCFVVDKSDVPTLRLLWSDDEYAFDGDFIELALR